MKSGVLFIISGPSGVGKGTLIERARKNDSSLVLSVSCTTRPPRGGEKDGVDYFFLTREEFEKRIREGEFWEYDEHFGNLYGTPKSFVLEQLKTKSVILEIDVVGALNIKRAVLESDGAGRVVMIMIIPPDVEALEERLQKRESESEEERRNRLTRVKYELSKQNEYDYVIVNDRLEEAEILLNQIISTEQNAWKRR